MQEAESQATGPMFQRSARIRAFAKAMGDDMETSSVGFAAPMFGEVPERPRDGEPKESANDEILMSGF